MPDIFDQVATPAAPSGSGDIFDQVAAPAPATQATPAPQAAATPSPATPPATVAGAGALGLPQPAAPAVDMPKPSLLYRAGINDSPYEQQVQQDKDFADASKGMPDADAKLMRQAVDAYVKYDPSQDAGSVAQVIRQDYDRAGANGSKELQNHLNIAGTLGAGTEAMNKPLARTGVGAVDSMTSPSSLLMGTTLIGALRQAPLRTIGGYIAGTLAGQGVEKAAAAAGATPQQQQIANSIGFFLPSVAARLAGVQMGTAQTPEGDPAAAASAFGGKVGAAAVKTPEAYEVRVGVKGGPNVGVRIPRAPSAVDITAKDLLDANTEAMQDSAKADQAAQLIVKGATPEQAVAALTPKPPPTPQEQFGAQVFPNPAVISQATMASIAQVIKSLPPEQQADAILEAHANLAKHIAAQQGKTILGPDGKTYQVNDGAKDGIKLASQFTNAAIDAHDSAQAEAQKQQQAAQVEAAKPAEQPKGQSKLQAAADEKLYQRAKTLIATADVKPGQPPPLSLLQRNLQIGYGKAAELYGRFQSEQLPTVGSKQEPVVEEKPETIDAQMDALKAGTIRVVHVPAGGKYMPEQPKGIQKVTTPSSDPGAGTYFFKPGKGLRAETIKAASKAGTHGDLTGHITPKEEIAKAAQPVAVVAQKPDGTEIQASEVDGAKPHIVAAQAAILAERHPGAEIIVKHNADVINDRLAKPDIFDQAAGEQAATPSQTEGGPSEVSKPEVSAAGEPEKAPAAPDRRKDAATRKKVGEMSPEDMRRELLTSQTVDLPNKRAFTEAESSKPAKAVAMSDADGLKALNDKFGYEAGNALLRAKAEALKEAGLDAYHDKGDEFLYRGESEKEIAAKLEKARELLRNAALDVTTPDGKELQFKGADFSYGTGTNLGSAESGLKQHKSAREASGERAPRGDIRGLAEVRPEKGEVDKGDVAEQGKGVVNGHVSAETDQRGEREGTPSGDNGELYRSSAAANGTRPSQEPRPEGQSDRELGNSGHPRARETSRDREIQTGEGPNLSTERTLGDEASGVRGVSHDQLAPQGKGPVSVLLQQTGEIGSSVHKGQPKPDGRTGSSGAASRQEGASLGAGSTEESGRITPAAKAEPHTYTKDERVRYTAKDGTEKVGRWKSETALGVRIAPDGGGKPDFISKKKILGPAEESKSATKPDKTTEVAPAKSQSGRQAGDDLPEDAEPDAIADVIRWSTMPHVGLRMVADDYPEIQDGDTLEPSHDWLIGIEGWGPDPSTRMEGTSAIEVSKDDPYSENRQRLDMVKQYPGSRLVVLESEEARSGRDLYETVMKTPRVLAVFGKKPVQEVPKPDEPATFVRKSLQTGKEETFTLPGTKAATLANHLYDLIQSDKMPKDNNALRAIVAEYDGKPVDNARLKEAQEALEEALVKSARAIIDASKPQATTFEALVKLYNSQPNLNIRTSTSMENQAYSTPAPLAYVASQLSGINPLTTVYEPTAGNGMLLIGADPKNVTANELNPDRAKALRAQGFYTTTLDAAELPEHAVVLAKSFDAVITNPPFGSLKDERGSTRKETVDGYKIGQIDHLIAARALDAMKDDGKATIILGADKVAGGLNTDARLFLNWLYSHYNVSSHFEVDGDLYGRQGANWPVRVINVDGRVRSDRFSPLEGTIQRVGTWKGVYEQLDKGLAAHGAGSVQPRADGSIQQPRNEPAEVPVSPRKPTLGISASGPSGSQGTSHGLAGKQPEPLADRDVDNAGGLAATDSDVRQDADASRSDQLPRGAKPDSPAKRDAKSAGTGGSDLTDADNAFQVKYTPASSKKDEGVLIPSNMRAPWEHAMRTLEDEVGDLDEYVAKELGYDDLEDMHDALMGLQVDSVAAAIHQMSKGKAIIIADQTGIGKGRQAAALIRWAINHNKTPVFMTAKPSLFTDMFGDLADIGSGDVQPFIVNLDESISLPNGTKVFGNSQRKGVHKAILDKIVATGEIPEDRNAVFLTYSQINTENTQREALRAIAHNAVLILDEAHTAAGESNTGEYMQGVVAEAPHVTYLSATFAKRPDNMPLYFRTDMGTAIRDGDKLQEALAMGGLPLQTVISTNLVKAGQLARRERSYDGVDIATNVDVARRDEHTKLADQVTTALRAIVKADKLFHHIYVAQAKKQAAEQGMSATGGGNKASSTIAHAEFTSIVHNFVRQMLLALKADSAADEAIASIKRGEKPLIAVEQTMGSFLSEYAAHNNIQDGAPLGDFTYRTVLHRALARTRYIVVKDLQGNDVKHYISMDKLDDETRAGYEKAQKIIDGLKMDLPMSPIDWIRQRVKDAGHTMAEITGRSLSVDYSDPKNPKLSQVPIEERTDKVLTTRKFNDGRIDAILLNVAGSTGISLHASEKFKDQRIRHMIVAQPAQDINVFMQMLGRIHRTGQVELPRYTILSVDLPAEKRPTALLSKKMKSLNANTSSNTESATSVKAADMLNKYGDEIVAHYLEDNPELVNQLGVTPMDGDKAKTDIARDVTGKLAITPVATQAAFYNEVEQAYNDHIDYLNETGQNELEPRTLDYDAKETRSLLLSKGEDHSSPFGEDSFYNEYSIKAQSKPLTPEAVKERIAQSLDGKNPREHAQALIDSLKPQLTAWQKTLDPLGATLSHSSIVEQTGAQFIRQHQIGQALRLEINGDFFNAAVTNIESSHKGAGNPFAMSKISVTLATTGPNPTLKVPATQLTKITLAPIYGDPQSLFELRNGNARETAKIITGNLLAAYGELKDTRGTIINFTKADGSMEQGILLPKKFEIATNTMGDYAMKSPEHVVKFLNESKGEDGKTIGVSSRDGNVRIVMRKGEVVIVTPKAKASGGKYFLDKKLVALTGDFVSSGTSMRAVVPPDKVTAAVAEVMKKAALYVPRSLAEEAASLEPKKGDTPRKSSGSTTMRMSLFGVDLLAEAVGKTVKVAWDKDIAPHIPAIGQSMKEVAGSITHLVAPTVGANVDVLDSMMRLKGDQEKQRFAVEQMFKGISKMWDSLPEQSRIDFLDNYKTGRDQISPELDKLAALYKAVDDATYRRIVDAQVGSMDRATRKAWDSLPAGERNNFFEKVMDGKDIAMPGDEDKMSAGDKSAKLRLKLQSIADNTLTFKADHFRSFWKVVPGTGEERTPDRTRRGPLRGDRGMLKRSTLPDVSTGIENGGVLVSTNPQKLFEMAQSSSLRYITALNMWKELGDLGMRKFVALGDRAPEGWVPVNDSIAKVYFPVDALSVPKDALPDTIDKDELRTRRTLVHTGDWYLESSAGRLLNNYLSKNWFQTNAVGRGLMAVKNLSTAVELSLSPFHLVFESLEAMGSQFGLGAMHVMNAGIGQGKWSGFLEGGKAMASAPLAPFTLSRTGGSAIKATANLKEFAATERGKDFLRDFPNAAHLIDLAFTGGLTMGMPADYRVNLMESARAAFHDGNYFGSIIRAVPGTIQAVMNPLFEKYIPRLKMGFFLQAMSQQMAEKHDALMNGEISEAELARKVVNSVENRFGELNFSNLFWDNTFKGAAQLMFRSVTWKLGNWRGAATGVTGQAKAFADPLKAMYDDVKGNRNGADRKPGDYIPKLDLNMSWLLGMAVTTAVIGTILSKLIGGKFPWEYLDEDKDRGMSTPGALALEMAHPRTGKQDSYTGAPTRLSLPTGLKDFEHGTSDPRGYLRGSESGFIGKALDTWDNKDFFGNYVYDPNGTTYRKLADILTYNRPLPITVQTIMQGKKTGDYTRAKLGAFGLTQAPKDLDLTPLEKHMEAIVKAKHAPETPEEQQAYHEKMQGIRDGSIGGAERARAMKAARKPYLLKMFAKLNYFEARNAYQNFADEHEKHELRAALMQKRANAMKRSPSTTRNPDRTVE